MVTLGIAMTKKEIGERIRARRHYLKLTQRELASRFGVQPPTMSQYESGEREIGSADLPRLAKILNVNVAYFYGEEPPIPHSLTVWEEQPDGSVRESTITGEKLDEILTKLDRVLELLAPKESENP